MYFSLKGVERGGIRIKYEALQGREGVLIILKCSLRNTWTFMYTCSFSKISQSENIFFIIQLFQIILVQHVRYVFRMSVVTGRTK